MKIVSTIRSTGDRYYINLPKCDIPNIEKLVDKKVIVDFEVMDL